MRNKLLIVALSLLCAEMFARLWMVNYRAVPLDVYRKAYVDAPYNTPEFFAEQQHLYDIWDYDANGIWRPADYNGRYFTLRNGIRYTPGAPLTYSHTMYVVGPSTVFSIQASDEYTIPAQLQKRLPTYRLINLGYSGSVLSSWLLHLKEMDIKPGDSVVYYAGFNEAGSVYYRVIAPDSWACRHHDIGLLDILCTVSAEHPVNQALLAPAIEDMRRRFVDGIEAAQRYTVSRGATFHLVIQPQLYTRPLTANEAQIIAHEAEQERGVAIAAAWPTVQRVGALYHALDLTHILDEMRDEHEVYVDDAHVTWRGNIAIAEAIADWISDF